MMNAGTVQTFVASAYQLLPALSAYAALEQDQRKPEHEALIRQLRIAASAVSSALMEVPRVMPMPTMPPPQA